MKFLFFLIFFLSFSSIMALNETNETVYADNTGGVWFESNNTEEPKEILCDEQLRTLLDEYNNLTQDYHLGASCGTVVYLLKDKNQGLGESLKGCREDTGKYRFGFWFFGIFLLIMGIISLYKGIKSKQEDTNGTRK